MGRASGGGRARRAAGRAALVAVAALAALLVAEFAWRAARVGGFGPTTNPGYVIRDPLLGWAYRPGASDRHVSAEFDVAIRIGEAGFRAPPERLPAGPDVVAIGDSFTFGWGVDADEAFPARLAVALDRQVWNLGICGYGPDQQLLVLRHRAPAIAEAGPFAPRVVVVTHCGNDVEEVLRDEIYGSRKPRYQLVAGSPEPIGQPLDVGWLTRNSELWRSLRKRGLDFARGPLDEVQVAEGRELVVALYLEMADVVATWGGRLVVQHHAQDWLASALAKDQRVVAFDVGPALDAAVRRGESVVFPVDGHWTAAGHAAVAGALAGLCRERRMLGAH